MTHRRLTAFRVKESDFTPLEICISPTKKYKCRLQKCIRYILFFQNNNHRTRQICPVSPSISLTFWQTRLNWQNWSENSPLQNDCFINVESLSPKFRFRAVQEPKITRGRVKAVRGMFHDTDSAICEKGACYRGGGWFFFNSGLFFINVCKQSFQNFTIIHGTDNSFLSFTRGWNHVPINDSTFVKRNNEHHFVDGLQFFWPS